MSFDNYRAAMKLGQKEYRTRAARGQYPYLQVLDEILHFSETGDRETLGVVDVPVDHIVGTKTQGRNHAFASNFMPLLDEDSEFAAKWAALADAHLEEGIREPVEAYEYMNRFYIREGNKRVSVLKYFGALTVPAAVTRILPQQTSAPEYRIYSDFLEFYSHTRINHIWFSQPGRFKSLLTLSGGADHVFTKQERSAFLSVYMRFRDAFKAVGGDKLPGTTGDAFLAYIKINGFPQVQSMTDVQLAEGIARCWEELAAFSLPGPVTLEMNPSEITRPILTRILPQKSEPLHALFLYERAPEISAWTFAHDRGRVWAQETLGDRVVTTYIPNVMPQVAEKTILYGLDQGAQVVFTTSPKLLPACIQAAAKRPEAKILNCCAYSPHPSIRTYYGRMYEVKFLAGMIAGAMTNTHKVGYMADYPIFGATAAINAFAMGVRMTDPWAKVFVKWRAQQEKGLWEALVLQGVDMISGQDSASPVDPWLAYGLYRLTGSEGKQIAAAQWNWGRFYEQIMRIILDGTWKQPVNRDAPKAINYWWGLSAGVVDLTYTDDVPADTLRLVELLRREIVEGRFHPFGEQPSPEEIVRMDYLAENVVGEIPTIGELTQDAREMVQLQGVRAEDKDDVL